MFLVTKALTKEQCRAIMLATYNESEHELLVKCVVAGSMSLSSITGYGLDAYPCKTGKCIVNKSETVSVPF